MMQWNWKERGRAASIHLAISLVVAGLAALLVFGQWYPYPYRELSGGRELFLILVAVDVMMGPLITLFIFNRAKPLRELRLDLVVVGALQLAALGYGLWAVSLARPVHLVFEFDRFRVVHAADVAPELLDKTPPGIDALPVWGPTMLSVRPFKDEEEKFSATMAALQGVSLASRPDLWQRYEEAAPRVRAAARPVSELLGRFPGQAEAVNQALKSADRKPENTVFLPMVGRKAFWTAFVDPATAQVVGFMPLDPF